MSPAQMQAPTAHPIKQPLKKEFRGTGTVVPLCGTEMAVALGELENFAAFRRTGIGIPFDIP